MAYHFPAKNNEAHRTLNYPHQYASSHQDHMMTQPMVPTASPYHHNPSIPAQAPMLTTINENIVYAHDMPSPYSFASSNSTVIHGQDTVYAQDYHLPQPRHVVNVPVNNNNQYQMQSVPKKHVTIPMNRYNSMPAQPKQYKHQSTVAQSVQAQPKQYNYPRPAVSCQVMQQIPTQQSSLAVHSDTHQQHQASIARSQNVPRISVNKVPNTKIPMVETASIELYSMQQTRLWNNLCYEYQKCQSLSTKCEILASGHYTGNILEDVDTVKLEQIMNKKTFQKIVQYYTKVMTEQMRFINNEDFNVTNTCNKKQIDGIFSFFVSLKNIGYNE